MIELREVVSVVQFMPPLTPYTRTYSFTDYQASNPSAPLPGIQVDSELENVEQSIGGVVSAINDVRRSDGKLKNAIVTIDSLSPQVAAGVGAGALASAEAAAASELAAAASEAAAASSASAAAGSAATASDALEDTEIAQAQADAARVAAQTARDFAYQWSSAGSGVTVNDGVNPVGNSAYHWAQVALDAAAGSIADGAITTAKLANGVLSADTTGRAKMADGFVTSAKILDGTIATGDLANGLLSADTTGRAKMADGFTTRAKLDAAVGGQIDVISGRNHVINAQGRINQRGYVSGTATSGANQYTLDRWRVVVSGQALTFTGDASRRIMTAPAGGVEQVIDGVELVGGAYVLNWMGTATASVNSTTRAKGETFSLTANTNATIRFTGGTFTDVQLEPGSTPTAFRRLSISEEIRDCQRYYEIGSFQIGSAGTDGSGVSFGHVRFAVPKRTSSYTISRTDQILTNASASATTAINEYGFDIQASGSISGQLMRVRGIWAASDEF